MGAASSFDPIFTMDTTVNRTADGRLEIVIEDGFARLQSLNDDGTWHYWKFTAPQARKLALQFNRAADLLEKQGPSHQ